ncbi:MAG: oligopeptide transporter, OPT family, partial [Thermoplasmata archaeon]|nr:oligopeptide transporter, OPT family [Thermoplasmata archaeon]
MAEKEFVPYISPDVTIPEFTFKAVLLGAILSIVMGAANAYLGLYAGMTVSATIPAAVIALAVFRMLKKYGIIEGATILETNFAKTMAAAGEALAAGVIFTIPALLLLDLWDDIDIVKTTVIALVGGCLGVLFTVSLRRVLIIDLDLPFPEGVAATEVLKTGEEGGPGVHYVTVGLFTAMAHKFAASEFGLSIFREKVEGVVRAGRARFYGGANLSPALMSVGYIIGLRISTYIFLGGILGWFILAPAIGIMQGWPSPPTGWVGPHDIGVYTTIWSTKIRYIGVGAMVVGGVYSIFRMRTAITKGVVQAFGKTEKKGPVIRTELDLDLRLTWILIGLFVIPIFAIYWWVTENLLISAVSSGIMLVAAFFFTAIAGYLAGIVGSSNNPISGVTIATLLFAALLLVALGAEGDDGMTSTILIAALVCCAAAIAGDVMQDLKTAQLLGATPRNIQIAVFLGVVAAALVIAPTLVALHGAYGIGSKSLPAPQAGLMAG